MGGGVNVVVVVVVVVGAVNFIRQKGLQRRQG